jgi:hypothetical protein
MKTRSDSIIASRLRGERLSFARNRANHSPGFGQSPLPKPLPPTHNAWISPSRLRKAAGVPGTSTPLRKDRSSPTPQSPRFALNQRMSQFALVGVRSSRHSSVTIKPHSEPISAPLLRGERPSSPRTVLTIRQIDILGFRCLSCLRASFLQSLLRRATTPGWAHRKSQDQVKSQESGKSLGSDKSQGTGKEPGNRRAARVGVASKGR